MNFSLTDTQLPMFLRIVNLCLALLNGEINDETVANSKNPADKDFKIDMPYYKYHEMSFVKKFLFCLS